jgi:hypothetical protein
MKTWLAVILIVIFAGATLAQDESPTPAFGSLISGETPTSTSAPTQTTDADVAVTQAGVTAEATLQVGSDARLGTCTAPTLPDFVPYIVRAGDRLGDLLTGVDNLTATQLAVLNCLDDPSALPVGATIWVPRPTAAGTAVQPDATGEVPAEAPVAAADMAEITRLEADSETVLNQEGVTFSWAATGAQAYFYPCPTDPDVECSRPAQAQVMPLSDALLVHDFPYAGPARFRLEVVGGDQRVTQDITISVECSQQSLGLVSGFQSCPELPPLAAFGVWQPFENGVMMYFADSKEIYVMTNADNRVQVFPDTFVEGMADAIYDDIPEGRFAARRGFGIVWNQLGGPGSPLGWALAEEIGFDTARQPAGRVSYSTYIKGPGDVVYAVTLVPDTDAGYWTQIKG